MFNSRWLKFGALLVILAGLSIAFQAYRAHVFQQGYDKAASEAEARERAISADAEKRLADAIRDARKREQALQDDLATANELRFKEGQAHEKAMSDLRDRVRAGDERLRVAVNAGSIQRCAASDDSAAIARPGDEARAELMPGTADAVFRIAAGITDLVRDYNAVVDSYNRARATCNAVTP